MADETAGAISVTFKGIFVLRVGFAGSSGQLPGTKESGDILDGQTVRIDPGDLGVPSGTSVSPIFHAVSGNETIAYPGFEYEAGNPNVAEYGVWGTTGEVEWNRTPDK